MVINILLTPISFNDWVKLEYVGNLETFYTLPTSFILTNYHIVHKCTAFTG